MNFLSLAIRNIVRNRRRTFLTTIAISIGVGVLFIATGFLQGFTSSLYNNISALDTGHVQIEAPAYRASARRLPLDARLMDPETIYNRCLTLPEVVGASIRVDFNLELSNGTDSMDVSARAINPQQESTVSTIHKTLIQGEWFQSGQAGLVIGSGLARLLKLKVGESAYFTAIDRHSVRNLGAMKITAIFSTGYPLMDDSLVFMDLEQAQSFLDLGKSASKVVLKARALSESLTLLDSARSLLKDQNVAAYDWKVLAEYLVSTIESRMRIFNFILIMLFVLILVGIINSMSMTVLERYKEIGTLRAIGMKSRQISRLLLMEGLWLGVFGTFAGILLFSPLAWYLGSYGLSVKGLLAQDIPMPFGETIRAYYVWTDAAIAMASGLIAAIIGTVVPAWRAGRLSILAALGNTR